MDAGTNAGIQNTQEICRGSRFTPKCDGKSHEKRCCTINQINMLLRGVALLAGCYIIGQIIGESLGQLLRINNNVGGVGFAMLLLILAQNELEKRNLFHVEMGEGVMFWSKMYIPVIVAMSAVQNVRVAFNNGILALLAGILPVVLCLLFMPILSKSKAE